MKQQRKRRSVPKLEMLESRQLLSAAMQDVLPLVSSTSTQVQAITPLAPTYRPFTPAGALSPLQTSAPQGYTPTELRTAYGMTQVTFGSVVGDGTGQTIAIIDAYNDPTIQADLHAFDLAFSLPDTTLQVVSQTGSSHLPSVDPVGAGKLNWEGEEALDVEWAHAMAPGAAIILVEANDASPSNLFAAVNWARQQADVSVISMSFAGNETSSETQYDSVFTTPAGHNGVTFVAAAGDSGAPSGYPAYSPNVLAVGGTSLALDSVGNYQSETAWSGSGGGISVVESQPSYQAGIVTQSSAFRTAPDVAFDAAPNTGVAIYDSYNNGTTTPWEIVGGTSLAAPAWAGLIAVANQGRVAAGEGTLDGRNSTLPLLYAAPVADFHDITTGSNGYAAGPGYDLVTGRGTPIANLLIPYLVSGTITPPPPSTGPTISSLTASSLTVTEGDSLTLTANDVSDVGGTGITVTFYEENNSVPGLQTDPTTGDYAFSPVTDGSNSITLDTSNAVGTFTFYAQVTDASGAASPAGTAAPSVTVTVVAPNASQPSIGGITATPNPVVTGNTLSLSVNDLTDPAASIRRVYYYQETNGIRGLQTGLGGDFAFRPVSASSGYSIELDTTGVTGTVTFYALAVDSLGNISATGTTAPSVDVTIANNTPPDAPTGLTATAASSSEIDLSFTETESGQTGFTIERSTSADFASFTRLFTINRPDAVTYSDTGLASGTLYYYRVQAFDAAGNSGYSNAAHATTLAGSTTHVTASAHSTVYGHGVTFTAWVTNPPAQPTGTVQFQVDGDNFGAPVTLVNGVAISPVISSLSARQHVVTAIYSGDSSSSPSTGTTTMTVRPRPVVVTVTNVRKTYGQVNPAFTGTIVGLIASDNITATYSASATQFSDAGAYAITPLWTDPNNRLLNYSVRVRRGVLIIAKAAQIISWTPPAAILHGTALSSDQLDASVDGVDGGSDPRELIYTPPLGAILTTGVHTLRVRAAGTRDYLAAHLRVSLTVTRAT